MAAECGEGEGEKARSRAHTRRRWCGVLRSFGVGQDRGWKERKTKIVGFCLFLLARGYRAARCNVSQCDLIGKFVLSEAKECREARQSLRDPSSDLQGLMEFMRKRDTEDRFGAGS